MTPPAGSSRGRHAPDEPWPFRDSDRHGWPKPEDLANVDEAKKTLWQAHLDVRKKRADQDIARAAAETEADLALETQYYEAVLDVAKGSIERARAGAETIQKAAAAIVTLYTGVLALVFSAAERSLPTRALFAAFLLGLAIVLAAAFVAYLPDPREAERDRGCDRNLGRADRRAARFIRWSRSMALRRRKWLRASVVALGTALFFLPAPFVAVGKEKAPAPAAARPDWPTAPAEPTDPELRRILYKAQVAETAEERKSPLGEEDSASNTFWWVAFGAALVLIVVVPQIGSAGQPTREVAA